MGKWNRWYKNQAFRRKVLLSHLAVSLIPVIILGAFCYIQTRNLLVGREKEVLSETLDQSAITLDSTLNSYVHVMENITWDNKIKQALDARYETNYEMYLVYRDVIDPTVLRLKSLNPQIRQLSLYSANPTLYPHGTNLMPVGRMEDFPGGPDDYNIHWLAGEDGVLKMYCRIYSEFNQERNVAYMDLDYSATFGHLTRLFGEDYGVIIGDQEGRTVFSYSSFAKDGTDYEALTLTDLAGDSEKLKQYVVGENTAPASGWSIYLYRPLKAVSSSAMSITFLMIGVIAFCLFIILWASVLLSRSVARPIGELIRNIDRIEEGNLSADVKEDSGDEIGHLINSFRNMVDRLNYMVNEIYKSKIAQQQYEMKALQAQINPHFLYNSLSLINWKAIMAGQEDISEMSQLLSTFYRTTLNKGKNIISVKGEWDNTCSYVRIQNMMHSGKLEVRTEIEEGMMEYQMLNLLLQPLVENAIVHGLDYKTDSGAKILVITGREEAGELRFTVCDNGCGIPQEICETILTAKTKGYGVQNVHHRIQLYYGEQYGLVFESRVGEGTRVTLRIPKVEAGEEEAPPCGSKPVSGPT